MTAKTLNPLEIWSTPATAAFKFWASLWPTAPLFGVEWRYADTLAQWSPLMGKAADAEPAAPNAAKPKTAKAKTAKPKAAVEAAPVAEIAPVAAPVTVPEAVPAATTEPAATNGPAATDGPTVPASLMVTAPAEVDDLTVLKGVGPALARQLNGLGVYKISQIAAFSENEFAWIDQNLPAPRGRCFRDDWAGQAKALLG